MRRIDKKVSVYRANLLAEQRYLNRAMLDEGFGTDMMEKIKGFMGKALPKIKDGSENALQQAKAGIAKTQDFAVEQWNDPENQQKLKGLYEKIKDILSKIKNAGIDILKDPKKLSALVTSLKLGALVSLAKGVWDLIFASSLDVSFMNIFGAGEVVSTSVGGIFFFKLAIFLYALNVVLKIVGGALTIKKVITGMVDFIKGFISIFTGKGSSEEPESGNAESAMNESMSFEESVKLLFETYGYENSLI